MTGRHEPEDPRRHLSAPLLAGLGLPRYRFVPGRNPHPIHDPKGHSYYPAGEPELETEPIDTETWHQSQDYLYGCDLYNHGYWWEAHEAWEGIWRPAPRGSVLYCYLQALIQVSAAHLQLYAGHVRGVRHLLPAAMLKLRTVRDAGGTNYLGVDVRGFSEQVDAYFGRILSGEGPYNHDAALYPYLTPMMPD